MSAVGAALSQGLGAEDRRFAIATRRRVADRAWWALAALALALVVAPVVWILAGVVADALPGWRWNVFTEVTTGTGGGLANAIVGTVVLTVGVGILAGFVGIGAGIYLAEFARPGRLPTLLRSASEVLSGIPSIVFGYCGYLVLVVGLHWGYSLLAALIVLSILVVPYIAKATELALNQVPVAYREGGEALGMPRTHLLRRVVMRAALPGVLTGLIVALAISVGETAPLLYTAGFSNAYPSGALVHEPVGYLTYAVYTFYNEPGAPARALASDAALILVAIVVVLILASRLLVRLTQRHAPDRAAGGRRIGRRGQARPA